MQSHLPSPRGRRGRVRVAAAVTATVAVVLPLLLVGAGPAFGAATSPLRPSPAAPPREDSPFSVPDGFCTKGDKPPPGRTASAPGVTAGRITAVMLTPAVDPVADAATGGAQPGDPVGEAKAFAAMVNRCGGILGRTLDVHVLTTTGDAVADCRRATALQPFVVVAWTRFDGADCVAGEGHTVMIASGNTATNEELSHTQGRLAVGGSGEGIVTTRILDLVDSGRLDGKHVAVVAVRGEESVAAGVRQLLAEADPTHKLTLLTTSAGEPDPGADVVVATSFDPAIAATARGGGHPVAVYSLGAVTDQDLDAVRLASGTDVAKAMNEAEVDAWITPALAQYRDGKDPSKFAQMCNDALADAQARAAAEQRTPTTTAAVTTTTVLPALPGGPYTQVAQVCLATRTLARALYEAGINPTARSMARALYTLPYIENAENATKERPNQVVNEPTRRARQTVFLAKAEYPCTHPESPAAGTQPTMCWVPVGPWEDGRPVNAPLGG